MSWVNELARENIVKLAAYRSARSIATTADIFLDANEAPGPEEKNLNRYPLPQPTELLLRFSHLYGVSGEQILMGRGSDEAIDLLTRAFCEPEKDGILITPPTYGMYKVAADIQNAKVTESPLLWKNGDWILNKKEIIEKISTAAVKLIYICSPNNPTGTVFSHEDLIEICRAAQGKALVVVDEAYGEFSPSTTAIPLLSHFLNLVVLRTLSKAWALAGLRCGVVIAHADVISLLQKVRAPYPLPQPVIDCVQRCLDEKGLQTMQKRVVFLISERERLREKLLQLPSVEFVFPSQANFLLVRFISEPEAMGAAKNAGILLRSRDREPGLKNCVRITIGNREENDLLLQALQKGSTR